MKTRILLITTLLFAVFAHLRAQVVFNATNFPDANFRQYLKDACSSYGFTKEGVTISAANLKKITTIVCNGREIASCKGIENFTELLYLYCNSNNLTALDISKNTKLTELICYMNNLTTLDVTKNTALESLDCRYGNLTSLDVSKNTKLTKLWCSRNNLTALDVTKNTALTLLYCSNTKLTTLNVSKNTKLTILDCSSNNLTALDVSKNTALTDLVCTHNNLTTLDVSKNTALTELICYRNNLRSLDLSKQTKLTLLSAVQQSFTDDLLIQSNTQVGLPYPSTVNAGNVKNMKIGGRAITPTNKAIGGTNYHTMSRTFAQVNDILWSSSPTITYDYDTKCPSTSLSAEQKLMSVTVTTTPYVACGDANGGSGNFPDANFRTVVKSSTYDKNSDGKLSKAELQAVTTINAASKGIANIGGIEYMKYLQTLNCSGNSLTALRADYHPSLRTVYCQNNQLTTLTFNQSQASLQYLNCSGNKFTRLNFTGFDALQYLDVSGQTSTSKLTGLTLPSSTALRELYCQNNAMTRMPGTTGLQIINCSYNQLIQGLNFTGFNALRELYCNNNNLTTTVTLPATSTLQRFHCHNNQLTGGLDASKNTGLVSLQCYNNPNLGTLKLPTTKTLTQLWCYNNGLSGTLDISYYTNLQDFGCQTNKISTLKLPATATLWRLHAYENELTALDVTANTGLTTLRCHNNRLRTLDLSKNASLTDLTFVNQTSTEDVSVFDYNKIGVYLPTGGKKANFLNMQVAGAARTADVLTNSGKQYLVVNSAQTGDVDLYGKTVIYSYNTECASPNFPNATMAVVVTTYPHVMWVNPNSKSIAGNYYSGTIVLDYDAVVPEGTEAYIITGLKATPREMLYDGTKYSLQQLNMTRIATAGQVIPANTPVYVKSATQSGLHAFGRNLSGATPVTVPSGNLLKGSATAAITGLEPYSILTLGREKVTREVGFWQYSGTTSAIHRCYLEASILNSTAASGAKGAVFCFDEGDEFGGTTDIEVVGSDSSAAAQDVWYTVSGVRLDGKPSKKGIYIHNGRKEVVR